MINKYGIAKKIGNLIKRVASSSIVKKLVQPVAAIGGMVPIAGPFVEKAIQNAPNTAYEFGNLITGLGEGKNVSDLLHNYYQNTDIIGNPLNPITLPNEGLILLRNWLKR